MALGTVADVVPLKGLNRAFVAKGLLALRRRERVGPDRADGRGAAHRPAGAWHLGFLLGPRINAGGRIGRADLGVAAAARRTIRSKPARIAAELDRLNRERQAIELATLAQAEAEAMAALGLEEKGAVVVTAAEGWHPGVVGLVAARLKERFGRPAFAIALEPGGIGTGSGRSIAGVDLGRAVRRAVAEGLLIKGGGHAMAAGVTRAQGRARAVPRLSRGDRSARPWRPRGADDALLIDGALTRGRRERRTRRDDRARRPVRRRQSRAGGRAAGAHDRLCRGGRPGACARAAALRRRRDAQRHRLPRGRPKARRRRCWRAAAARCTPPARSRIDRWQGEERVQFRLADIAPAEPFVGG